MTDRGGRYGHPLPAGHLDEGAHRHLRERALLEQGLVERDAEAELIAARVDLVPAGLLGGHIGDRTHHRAGLGEPLVQGAARREAIDILFVVVLRVLAELPPLPLPLGSSQPEIEDAHPTAGVEHAIGRLEVAVDQAGIVGGGQASTRLQVDLEALPPRGLLLATPLVEVLPPDQLHGDEQLAVDLPDLVDLHHVGMRQLRQRLSLAQHPVVPAARILVHQLDRDLAIERLVVGAEDRAHPSAAQGLQHEKPTDPMRHPARIARAPPGDLAIARSRGNRLVRRSVTNGGWHDIRR